MFHLLTWQSADYKHDTPAPWALYLSSPYLTICWPQTWHSSPMSSVCFISLPDNLLTTNMTLQPHEPCIFHLLTWQSADYKHGTLAPWVLYVSSPYLTICWLQTWHSSPMSSVCFISLPDNLLTTNMALHPHEFCMFHLLTRQSADHKHGTPSPWVLYVSSPYLTICWLQTWHSSPMSPVSFISLPDNLLTTNMAL